MVSKKLIVQKFGGATLANPEMVKDVAKRIANQSQNNQIIAVVSAMGTTTNELIQLAHQISKHPPQREMDMLITTGERMSMALVSMALNDRHCPAVSFTGSQAGIITDDHHYGANIINVKPFRVKESLDQGKVVVLAGFQGVSEITKEVTTLGRGGSDISAVAIAAALNAERCEILKDVPSIYSCDPKLSNNAKPLHHLSYDQLIEMTFWGAKVINYKCAQMAKDKNVSLYIGPANHDSNQKGTWISEKNEAPVPVDTALNFHEFAGILPFDEMTLQENILKNGFAPPQILKSTKDTILFAGTKEIMLPLYEKLPTKKVSTVSLTQLNPNLELEKKEKNVLQKLEEAKIAPIECFKSKIGVHFVVHPEDRMKIIEFCL